jgi:hypothetical protein
MGGRGRGCFNVGNEWRQTNGMALYVGECSASRFGRFTSWDRFSQYPFDRRLGGLQNLSGGGGGRRISLPLRGIEPARPARSLVTILTELPRLPVPQCRIYFILRSWVTTFWFPIYTELWHFFNHTKRCWQVSPFHACILYWQSKDFFKKGGLGNAIKNGVSLHKLPALWEPPCFM